MFPENKQPWQLSPGPLASPWSAWRGFLLAKGAPGWAAEPQEGSWDLWALHSAVMSSHFLLSFFLGSEKTPPDPADFWFWFFFSQKVQAQSWTSGSVSSGTVTLRGTLSDFSSLVYKICKEHKSHADCTHPGDVPIENFSFHNVLKKEMNHKTPVSMSWARCKCLLIFVQRNFWLWALDPLSSWHPFHCLQGHWVGHLCCYMEFRVLGEPGEGSPPSHRVTGSDSHLVKHTKQQHQKLITETKVGG